MTLSSRSSGAGFYDLTQRLVGKSGMYRHLVENVIRPQPGFRILDIGCGTGELLRFLPGVTYLGFDCNPGYVAAARRRFGRRGEFIVGNLEDIDLGQTPVDVVVAVGVMHHLDDSAADALCRLATCVLEDAGRLVTLDPAIVPGRSLGERLLTGMDRGRYVRTPASYGALIRQHFADVSQTSRDDLTRLTQTLVIFEARIGSVAADDIVRLNREGYPELPEPYGGSAGTGSRSTRRRSPATRLRPVVLSTITEVLCDPCAGATAMSGTPVHTGGGDQSATARVRRTAASWIVRALLVAVSIALALYLCEGALLLVDGKLWNLDLYPIYERGEAQEFQRAAAARRLGHPFDTRSWFEVIRDGRAQGRYLVPPISPSVFYRFGQPLPVIDGVPTLPLSGISLATTILCNESGRYSEYESDEHGFRNPRGLYERPVDVALVGDSFVQGFCVSNDAEPGAAIRKYYRAVNLGVSGAGPLMSLALLREYAVRLQPRVVLWFVFEGNDLTDLEEELRTPLLAEYANPRFQQGLWSKQAAIDEALRGIADTMLRERLAAQEPPERNLLVLGRIARSAARLSSVRGRLAAVRATRPVPAKAEAFETVLGLAKHAVEGWGGRLILVYLPDITRFSQRNNASPSRPIVFDTAGRLAIPVIDVESAFASSPDPLGFWPYRQPGHYTERGYARLAAAILQRLHAK